MADLSSLSDTELMGMLNKSESPLASMSDADLMAALGKAPQQPKGTIAQALEPITSYPSTYAKMNEESRNLIGQGIEQAQKGTVYDALMGSGKTAFGGLGYVTSPINAALRTVVGQPLENLTGIPKEYSEFAAGMALPIPSRVPTFSRAAKVEPKAAPTVAELKQSYVAAKESPEVAAVSIKPEALVKFSDEVAPKLNAEWLDSNLAPKTYHILEKLTQAPEGSTVTMANVDSARRLLGRLAGKGDEEAAAASIVKKELDKWMMGDRAAETLTGDVKAAQAIMQGGRADYTAAKLGEALDSKIAKAELQAASTHSGQNLTNQLRQKARQFLDSGDSRTISAAERTRLEAFIEGSNGGNLIRWVGKFLGGGGGLGALTAGGVGHIIAGPAGIAAPAVGWGLTKLGNVLASRDAAKLSEMLRSRSPLAQKVTNPLQNWSTAAQEIQISPNARNISRLTIASRNLSNNLKDAGIMVSPNDLMRSLFGQKPAGAEPNQQE